MSEPKLCTHFIVVSQSVPGVGSIDLNVCRLLRDADEVTGNEMAQAMADDGVGADNGILCFWDGSPCPCRYFS
jgi:hypothetical protein